MTYARLLLMLTSLITLENYVNAQSRLHGKIVDNSSRPIAFANVLLLNANDSVLVKGVLTNDKGIFILENISPGKYVISAIRTGLNPVFTRNFEISHKIENIDVGDIKVYESRIVLAGVTGYTSPPAMTSTRPDEKLSLDFVYLNYHYKNPSDYTKEYFVDNSHSYTEKVRSDKIAPLKSGLAKEQPPQRIRKTGLLKNYGMINPLQQP